MSSLVSAPKHQLFTQFLNVLLLCATHWVMTDLKKQNFLSGAAGPGSLFECPYPLSFNLHGVNI